MAFTPLEDMKAANARLDRSFMGRAFKRGTLESFGFFHEGTTNTGFLGLGRNPVKGVAQHVSRTAQIATAGFHGPVMGGERGAGAAAKYAAGAAGKTFMQSIPLLFTGYFAYQGYQQQGIYGAAKGVAESVAYSTAWHAGAALLGGPATALLAAGAIGAGGYYAFGEMAQAHRKRLTSLEMGNPSHEMLQNAGTHTERARSLAALQNTFINGRMALGNEAMLSHTTYR